MPLAWRFQGEQSLLHSILLFLQWRFGLLSSNESRTFVIFPSSANLCASLTPEGRVWPEEGKACGCGLQRVWLAGLAVVVIALPGLSVLGTRGYEHITSSSIHILSSRRYSLAFELKGLYWCCVCSRWVLVLRLMVWGCSKISWLPKAPQEVKLFFPTAIWDPADVGCPSVYVLLLWVDE